MRHFIITALLLSNSLAFARSKPVMEPETQVCYESSKELYMEIQVYKETEKIQPEKAIIGSRLEFDLSLMNPKSNLSISAKVHSLETAFAQCDVNLSEEEHATLKLDIEEAKQSLR